MKPADFLTDVNDATNKKAEEIVFRQLQSHFRGERVEIRDLRSLNLKWDFTIVRDGREYTLDVKCDHYIEATQRVAFEMYHIHDNGGIEPSWGLNPRLDFIAVIPDTFRFIKILPLHYVRSYVCMMQKLYPTESLLEHRHWKEIMAKNRGLGSGWMTYGWAVPLSGLERYCEVTEASITSIDTPHHLHQRTGGRLLINGKEVAA